MARLTYDIHRSDSITTPATLGSQGNTLQLVINGSTYTYALNGTNLDLTVNSEAHQLNSIDTGISNLTFQRIGNINGKNTIVVNFTITSTAQKTSGEQESKVIRTTIGIR